MYTFTQEVQNIMQIINIYHRNKILLIIITKYMSRLWIEKCFIASGEIILVVVDYFHLNISIL